MAGYRAQAGDREHRTPMAWQHRDHISSDGHSHRSDIRRYFKSDDG